MELGSWYQLATTSIGEYVAVMDRPSQSHKLQEISTGVLARMAVIKLKKEVLDFSSTNGSSVAKCMEKKHV